MARLGRGQPARAIIVRSTGVDALAHTSDLADLIGLSDSLTSEAVFAATFGDPLGLSDVAEQAAAYLQEVAADSVGFTDAAERVLDAARTIIDGPGGGYLSLPGLESAHASTPDSPALRVGGSIDIRALILPDLWINPGGPWSFLTKRLDVGVGGSGGYRFMLRGDGYLQASFWLASNIAAAISTVLSPQPTTPLWVQVTRDHVTGDIIFYTFDGTSWVQLGATVNSFVGTMVGNAAPLAIGAYPGYAPEAFSGRIDAVEVRAGIDGPPVAGPDFRSATSSTFADAYGNTWTVNGTAVLVPGSNLADSVASVSDTLREAADPEGLTDSADAAVGYGSELADVLGLSDAAEGEAVSARDASDPLGLTDAASPESGVGSDLADLVGLTDQAERVGGVAGEPSDDLSLADAIASQPAFARSSDDAEGLTDEAARTAEAVRSADDQLGVTDQASGAAGFAANLADPERLRDASAAFDYILPRITRLLADDENLTDSSSSAVVPLANFSDPLGVTDAAAQQSAAQRDASDPENLTDQASAQSADSALLADAEGLTDQMSYSIDLLIAQRLISDAEGLTDLTPAPTMAAGRLVADAEALADVTARLQVALRDFADPLTLADAVTVVRTIGEVFLFDAEALGDGVVLAFVYGPHLPFPIVAVLLLAPTPTARIEVAPSPTARLVVAGPPSARVTLDPTMHDVLPLNDRLAIRRGDDARLLIRDAVDENGDPFDWALSPGIQVTWTLRRQPADTAYLARRTNAPADGIVLGAPGEGTIILDGDGPAGQPSHTSIAGDHWCDLQVRTTSDDVHTLTTAEFIIEDDVSRP